MSSHNICFHGEIRKVLTLYLLSSRPRQKTGFDISYKLSLLDNLHEISNPVFLENKKKYFKMSSAENFTQSAKQ